MRGSKGVEIRRPATRGVYLCTMVALLFVICGCGEQLTRMEENQVKLQAMVAANARELATLSSQVHTGAGKLEAGIQDLDADAQGIATQVQTVQDGQQRLHETVVAVNQSLDARASQLQEGQQALQNHVTRVQTVADRTAADLSTLSQRHVALHETVQANQRELKGQMGAVVSNQEGIQAGITSLQQADVTLARDIATVTGKQDAFSAQVKDNHKQVTERLAFLAAGQERFASDLLTVRDTLQSRTQALSDKLNILEQNQNNQQAGIDRLFARANQTAATITAIAAAQTAMQESLNHNHDQVVGRLASLAESQQNLHAEIGTLNGKADQAAADSSAATASLQESMRTGREAIAGQIGVSLQNQQAMQASLLDLRGKTDNVAAGLSRVQSEQTAARETMKTNQDAIITAMAGLSDGHEALGSRMTTLAENQRSLRNEVDTLTATSGQTALAVLTMNNGQASFQQAMQTGMNGLHEKADQTTAQVHGMTEQQTVFQESIRTSNETLVARAAAIETHQEALNTQIGKTAKVIDRAYADLTGVSIAQDALQATFAGQSDQMKDRMTRIEANQQSLGEGQDALVAVTGQTAIDVLALANGQRALQRNIRTGNETVLDRTTVLAQNQKSLTEQLDVLTATAGQTALDVLALEGDQAAMARKVEAGWADLGQKTNAIANSQRQTQGSVDVLTATASQTALDVINIADKQSTLQKAVRGYGESTTAQMGALVQNQQRMQAGLDAVVATTDQTATDVTGVAARQDALKNAIQGYSDSTAARMATLAQNQQKIQTGLDTVAATSGQTATDVTSIAAGQDTIQKAIHSNSELTASQIAAIAEKQQEMQTGLDAVAATTTQSAADVTGVAARQDALQKAVQGYSDSTIAQIGTVAESQKKMQSSLDTVATTTGQTARDVVTLGEAQARSEQGAQAGRAEVAGRLEAIAQDQQSWLQRFDATQARIQAMADSIATLDEQLGKLQGTLQTGAQSATAAADANDQQRQQFEAKIAQDVQAMIDAIAQLRQAQAQLQEQMSQVQRTTQNQAETLKATLDQIKQPPAEVKVSGAASGVESMTVQTGE